METVMAFAPKTAGQSRASRRKVKTGCATCRTRKVKCDEGRPACQKCVSTGRTCDGYASPFRAWAGEHQSEPPKGMAQTAPPALVVKAPIALTVSDGPSDGTSDDIAPDLDTTASDITAADIDALQRCFSTKTLFPTVTLSCDDEARQILQASKTDPAVRHAVSSLRALRADLEAAAQASSERAGSAQSTLLAQATSAYAVAPGTTPSRDYGLQQYCLALGGLASHLSLSSASLGPTPSVRSALLCCQIFISIEQMRGDLAAMAQHIVQGLRILYEHQHPNAAHARPRACKDDDAQDLPALDVFVIKLFAAPCKFADITFETPSSPGTTPSSASTDGSESGGSASSWRLRPLAPDLSAELIRLALESLSFLAGVRAGAPVSSLSSKKEYLLRSLATWHARLQREQLTTARAELLSILFLRFFHQTVRVVILSASRDVPDGAGLGYTEGSRSEILDDEYRQLQSIASIVGERVRADGRQGGDW
ncbi:hypothetical protein SPBR_04958 [Sporothrix brasiliensis 5110]|uniref:Zn(2)-C6 fungal-type domain-containing protein n=1 Tax=Sporothrix brasiliensis 5110 TaxID=1398154 RepID=A0A0C2IQG4_9PEZI|nr:uncharacterized protein SPBR_04958 [Sporothrix brasiliensis 5110]KIH87302.1 hypothetical protein SPBR_04958 [Sporothrix brasiliensis 5110]